MILHSSSPNMVKIHEIQIQPYYYY